LHLTASSLFVPFSLEYFFFYLVSGVSQGVCWQGSFCLWTEFHSNHWGKHLFSVWYFIVPRYEIHRYQDTILFVWMSCDQRYDCHVCIMFRWEDLVLDTLYWYYLVLYVFCIMTIDNYILCCLLVCSKLFKIVEFILNWQSVYSVAL
jgi:hypothetical protein